jgi:hypothetical protein
VTRREGSGWSAPRRVGVVTGVSSGWSPDGSHLASVHQGQIRVVSARGGEERLLGQRLPADIVPRRALWAADGRSLVVKALDRTSRTSFWSVPIDGTVPRRLTTFPDPRWQSGRADFALRDGRLYFAVEDRQSDVFTMEVRRP